MVSDSPFLRRKLKEESGFTLIETVLTMVILAAFLGIVFSAMRIGVKSWEKGEAVMEKASVKRTVTTKLAKDISSAYPYKEHTEEGDAVLFSGGSKTLGFVSVSGAGLPGLPWGGAKWVYYSVRDGKLTVREKTVPCSGVERDEGGRLIVLDRGVAGVSFEYLGGNGWERHWYAADQNGLPVSIRVNISFNDGRKAVTESVIVGLTHERQKKPAA